MHLFFVALASICFSTHAAEQLPEAREPKLAEISANTCSSCAKLDTLIQLPCKTGICEHCLDTFKRFPQHSLLCTKCHTFHDGHHVLSALGIDEPSRKQMPEGLSVISEPAQLDPLETIQVKEQMAAGEDSRIAMGLLAMPHILEVLQAQGKINVAQHLPMAKWLALFGAMSIKRSQYQHLLSDRKAIAGFIHTVSKLALAYQAVDFAKKLYLLKDPKALMTKETAKEFGSLVAKMGGISAVYMLAHKLKGTDSKSKQ